MESQHIETDTEHDESTRAEAAQAPALSRRDLLRGATSAPALMAGGSVVAASLLAARPANAEVLLPESLTHRRNDAHKRRTDAAKHNRDQWKDAGPQPTNNDESYADARGSFHKYLPHDALGQVTPAAYAALRTAMASGDPADFDAIPLDPAGTRRLANPQAALAYVGTGLDGHFGRIAAPPAFTSLETAAEMGELYWAALTRDVPFRQYGGDALVGQAVADLNGFSQTVGPKQGGLVTASTLFRGETAGDLVGPYISQLLWKPVPFGPATIEQRYRTPVAVDFMTSFPSWLAIQRGVNPAAPIAYLPGQRYIHSGRALGEYVHLDQSYQAFLFAALILLSYGGPALTPSNPYNGPGNQGAFTTFGGPEVLDMVAKVANLALRVTWWQKWSAHRRLRPEAYGGRLQVQLQGLANYGLPAELANSDGVAAVLSAHGTALLPQAFPEGSPSHPAYPAGHAAIAGACSTVLKAYFNEAFAIPSPVEATDDGLALDPWLGDALTVGGELDKLASNISLGRDTAGVHYRSDGIEGMRLGEQVALALLADETRNYNEDFGGFELTSFDGTPVLVAEGEVYWP